MAGHKKPRVVVVGAGFGGLRVAKGLRGKGFAVVVVDQHNYHTFMPLLYQVATAALEPEQIIYPVRGIFDTRSIRFLMARVDSVDLAAKTLQTTRGILDYDYLVLAAGSVTNFFGQKEIEAVAHGDYKTSKVVGRRVEEIRLPPGATIGAIAREDEVIICHHDTVIEADDHVILFLTDKKRVPEVERLFAVGATFL